MIHSPLNKWLATVALITSALEASSEPKAQDEALDNLTEENHKVKNQNVRAREAVEATKQAEKERVKEYFKDHLNDSHAGDLLLRGIRAGTQLRQQEALRSLLDEGVGQLVCAQVQGNLWQCHECALKCVAWCTAGGQDGALTLEHPWRDLDMQSDDVASIRLHV